MSGSTTNLDTISASQSSKEVTANALFNVMSGAALFGYRRGTSTGLTWGYYGGTFRDAQGDHNVIANGTLTLTDSATNYIEVDGNGTVSSNTSGFTAGRVPLYSVVCASGAVSSYVDYRTGNQGYWDMTGRHIVTMAYAATLNIDWSLGYDVVRMTLTGNATINMLNGGDGQKMMLELTQDGSGNRTVTWGSEVRFSVDIPEPALTTSANKMDRLGFMSVAGGSPQYYDLIALAKGY